MDPQLIKAIREQTRNRTTEARRGKGYLIYFVNHHVLRRLSAAQWDEMNGALTKLIRSAENQAVQLRIESKDFQPSALPGDIDGPEAGLYLCFVWNDESLPNELERIAHGVRKCFERTNVESMDVTDDLERIFLLVFGQ